MTDEEKAKEVKEILLTYAKGGSMAHNIIRLKLTRLAKFDKALADKTFKTLEDRGY